MMPHSLPHPTFCRCEAFRAFAAQLPLLDTTPGLLYGAVAISMHAFDDVRPEQVDARLSDLAHRVRRNVRSQRPDALLAHLHEVLFVEEGFAGNCDDYYNPLNSFLPAVLELKRGIPITLALIYKVVAERVGLQVQGINTPGHFLARVRTDTGWTYVDPFHQGRLLTHDEVGDLVSRVLGSPVANLDDYLLPTTHWHWLARMLHNLQNVLAARNCRADLGAMCELQALLTR